MTSTDVARISRRLPPLPGLLENLLDEAMRARRRRIMVADNPAMNLNALRVTDDTLDRLVRAAAMYGADAAAQLDARIAASTGSAQEAAVFLRIALAVQARAAGLAGLAARHVDAFPRAVRDACWFYPVPNSPFGDAAPHLPALFEAGGASAGLRLVAVELAGLRAARPLHAPLRALLDDPGYAAASHVALARMGHAGAATQRYAVDCLATGEPAHIATAMAVIGSDPRLADDALLQRALAPGVDPEVADAAWAIAVCRAPRAVLDHANARAGLPAALRARIAAIGGDPADIIAACGAMAAADGPVTRAEADLLELALGAVPAEARCDPNDGAAKARALRALLLRALRQAHVGVRNDADIAPWEADAILADPVQAGGIRLREGGAMPAGVPALGRAVHEVSHGLRRWLYIERACLAGHPLALSPFDVARRQDALLMAADFADAMQAS